MNLFVLPWGGDGCGCGDEGGTLWAELPQKLPLLLRQNGVEVLHHLLVAPLEHLLQIRQLEGCGGRVHRGDELSLNGRRCTTGRVVGLELHHHLVGKSRCIFELCLDLLLKYIV